MEKVRSEEDVDDSRSRGDSGDTESSSCSSSETDLASFTLKSGEDTSPPLVAKTKAPESVFTFSSNLFGTSRSTASWVTPPLPPGGPGNRFSQSAAATTNALHGRHRRNALKGKIPLKSPSSPPLARNLFDKGIAPPPVGDMYISDDDESEATNTSIPINGGSNSCFHDLVQVTSRGIHPGPGPNASQNLPRFSPPTSRDHWTPASLPTSRASSPGFQASASPVPIFHPSLPSSSVPFQRRPSHRKVALGHRRSKSLSSGTAPSFRYCPHHRPSCGGQTSRGSSGSFLPPLPSSKHFENERKSNGGRSNQGSSGRISPLFNTSLLGKTRASSTATCPTIRALLFRVVISFVVVFALILNISSVLEHERSMGTSEKWSPEEMEKLSPLLRALREGRDQDETMSAGSRRDGGEATGKKGSGSFLGSFLPVHLSPSRTAHQDGRDSSDKDVPVEFQQPLQSLGELSKVDSKLSRRSIRQTSALLSQSNDENGSNHEFNDRRGRIDGTSASSADASTTAAEVPSSSTSSASDVHEITKRPSPDDQRASTNSQGKDFEKEQLQHKMLKASTGQGHQENSSKDENKEHGVNVASNLMSNATADKLKFPHGKVRRIALLGERNSGTRWMVDELQRCFPGMRVDGRLLRWKHWFQEYDSPKHTPTYVVAQFRNVYEWVEAMRHTPHHAPAHSLMEWPSFVQTPWTMERPKRDLDLLEEAKRKPHILNEPICHEQFYFHQLNSCVLGTQSDPEYVATFDNTTKLNKYGHRIEDPHDFTAYQPMYELKNDGSGQPYESILDLRADKIRNFLSVASWSWVAEVLPIRYEDMLAQGTESVIRRIEDVTGVRRSCEETSGPQTGRRRRELEPAFVKYLTEHVDWEAEALAGYTAWDEPTFQEFLRWELRTTSSSGDSDSKDLPTSEQERLMDAAVNRAKDKMSGKIVNMQSDDGSKSIDRTSKHDANSSTTKSAPPNKRDETNFDDIKLAREETTVTVRAAKKYPIQRRKLLR